MKSKTPDLNELLTNLQNFKDLDKKIPELKQILKNASSENYKNIFSESIYINGEEGPAGNNLLLLAVAAGSNLTGNRKKEDIDKISELVCFIIKDAKEKLKPEEFQNFVNFKFVDKESWQNFYVNSPLTLSVKCGLVEIADLLVNHGADPFELDGYGFSSAHLAAIVSKELYEKIKQKHKEVASLKDRYGFTPEDFLNKGYINKVANLDKILHFNWLKEPEGFEGFEDLKQIKTLGDVQGKKDIFGKFVSFVKDSITNLKELVIFNKEDPKYTGVTQEELKNWASKQEEFNFKNPKGLLKLLEASNQFTYGEHHNRYFSITAHTKDTALENLWGHELLYSNQGLPIYLSGILCTLSDSHF